MRVRWIAGYNKEGWYIFAHPASHSAKTVGAHANELMNQRETAQYDMIFDPHVPAKRGAIGKDRVIPDLTVVGNMRIRHQQILVSYTSDASAARRSTIQCAVLANNILISDFQSCGFTRISNILRSITNGGELEYLVITADSGGPLDDNVRTDPGTFTDFDVRPDNRERANLNVRSEACTRMHNGPLVNQMLIPRSAHMSSALVTTIPSTLASAENFHMPRILRSNST